MQFPVSLTTAAQDHPLLEPDVLNSLFRRLQVLNKCVHLRQQHQRSTHSNEDSEDECALSNNWTFQSDIRRWSRACTAVGDIHAPNSLDNTDEVFEDPKLEQKNCLRRCGSMRFRRRAGVLASESGVKLLNTLSEQLSSVSSDNNKQNVEFSPKNCASNVTTPPNTNDKPLSSQNSLEKTFINSIISQNTSFETSYDSKTEIPLHTFSSTQLHVLHKLALLKLTALMEKFCPTHKVGFNWELPRFIRKRTTGYKDKIVFGVPITVNFQKTGYSLPRSIEESLEWLEKNAIDQVGIFRKSGVKSRIQVLRQMMESQSILNFRDQQSYDVADMVKQYFRELPEALLTSKLSETFIMIFQYIPLELRKEAVLCAILLLPDEHVEVFETLIYFLISIAKHASINQMNEANLATCFAPTLIHYSISKQGSGMPHPKDLAENKAGYECLLYFLSTYNLVFTVPNDFFNQCKSNEIRPCKVVKLCELGKDMGGWKGYLNECQQSLLKEVKEKSRGWVPLSSHKSKVEIAFKKIEDGLPLRLWRILADIEAPPYEVLHRILRERHIWDPELISAKIVKQMENNTEIFQFRRKRLASLPFEEYCVLRTWKKDLPKDACLVVETSVEHDDMVQYPNTIRGIVLASRYFIEPCGSGRSRIYHYSRVDTMGRKPEWYHKNYGHLVAFFIANIQNSFHQRTTGPESKV